MSKGKPHKTPPSVPKPLKLLQLRSTIIILFGLITIIGIPLRIQNIKLNGYISDDAWWHYRQVKQVVELGHRLDPDIYEFTTLNRPMTYPPLFHYAVAYSYKIFGRGTPLIKFTNYFNIVEALLYLLFIYGLSCLIGADRLFSLIGALAASVSYGIIIRSRAGELMPFVLGDLFAMGSVLILLNILRIISRAGLNPPYINVNTVWLCLLAGILMGLSLLAWNGGVYIYLPLVLFIFAALGLSNFKLGLTAVKLFFICFAGVLITSLPWYLPFVLKYGINPHNEEMSWFMKGFTVLHQFKPFNFYIFTSGIAIFFLPVVLLSSLFKKTPQNIFFNLWIALGAIATYIGWRGYVAVVPIISAIAISVGLPRIIYFFFKKESKYISLVFILIFLLVGGVGYYISNLRLAPLDAKNINEVRTNEKSIKMLEFLKNKYAQATAVDLITWVSEDEAVGSLKMVSGQYLEYLPKGSSEVLKDVSRIYLSDEENAYNLCQKYNADLLIVRRQILQLPQLSLLFAPSELKSDDYLKVVKESAQADKVTINFTARGMQTVFFRMLNRQKLQKFELVYAEGDDNPPFVVVYKVIK